MDNNLTSSLRLRDRIGLVAVAVAGAFFVVLRFGEFPVGAGMDDAYYIEIARSLAEGRGPVIHLNDMQPGWRPGLFPLGFPLLLSPLAWLVPGSVQIFKVVPLLALAGMVPLCLLLARRTASVNPVALTALVCLNPWTLGFAVKVFSDLPFTFLSTAAVLLFWDLAEVPRVTRARFIALVIVSTLAVMVRSIGLALPAAMALTWLWHRQWRRALMLSAGVVVALVPHALISRDIGGGYITRGYLQQVFAGDGTIGSRLELMAGNLIGYLKEMAVVLCPVFGNPLEALTARTGLGTVYGPLQLATGIILAGGIVWGLMTLGRTWRRRSQFLTVYLVIYAVVLLNFSGYPSGVQTRLLVPILPWLVLALLAGLGRRPGPLRGRLLWPTVAVLLSMSIVHNGYRSVRPMNATPDAAGLILVDPGLGADWIRSRTGEGDLVMVRRPLRQHIHLLRPVVGFGTIGPKELDQRIKRFGVDYILLGPGNPDAATARLSALVQADSGRFEKVHQDPGGGVIIFRVGQVP